ncbi:hypothetical protein HXA34_20575 [Salipaludibacillus agaradhaerens]|jgi:lipopolysaccharide export LptBFGC system permease protein LptF|uniref:hypothetical protein n=1 Tax=Salipaludibacillus agaradhaerens TaxID=76935 RepID=UPI002150DB2B|nr:hypothetical protein [Salipaludibacillus agaradhaerens]MCR6108695.1 hypothetical protein [Salipaludibacillus agaradhaerens]MCR6120718.1 hypothetical protein [Salipaludibacillus agaradhaerens]
MSNKKRKRRSFWEPESEKLVTWIDQQSDLGTSLQLIIIDAIHKYGEGDVIKAHLNQRENLYYGGDLNQEKTQTAPKDNQESKSKPDAKEAAPQEPEVKVVPEAPETNQPDNEPVLDIADVMTDTDDTQANDNKNKEASEEESYDPIDIMMNDIGSTFNK